ncbi:hypothetical protein BXZ70DRAFT_397129 [Cristinia sonorae]|uniref:Uncharacterized protein n=1 Tax=Cristinia sonorae TaxID=1940300 RepID=A0A8K0UW21_9AGAR|nr:hypothetical protein BXZ70DRAFT_397129 [Cristinia sonorae]
MRYEGSSSKQYRDTDDWRPPSDRYDEYSPSKDRSRRGRGDDVDHRGDSDAWAPTFGSRQSKSNTSRADNYGEGNGGSGKLGWTPPARYDDREADFSKWSPKDNKSGRLNDKNRNRWDSHDKQKDWGRDGKDLGTREWQSDNGWESRRRATSDDAGRRSGDNAQAGTSSMNERGGIWDRSWEPAPSWRQQQNQGGNTSHNTNANNSSNRSGDQQQAQGQRKSRHKNKKKNRQKQHDNNMNTNNGNTNGTATGSNAVKPQREQDRGWQRDDSHLNK